MSDQPNSLRSVRSLSRFFTLAVSGLFLVASHLSAADQATWTAMVQAAKKGTPPTFWCWEALRI